jgi:hypothetical protein
VLWAAENRRQGLDPMLAQVNHSVAGHLISETKVLNWKETARVKDYNENETTLTTRLFAAGQHIDPERFNVVQLIVKEDNVIDSISAKCAGIVGTGKHRRRQLLRLHTSEDLSFITLLR